MDASSALTLVSAHLWLCGVASLELALGEVWRVGIPTVRMGSCVTWLPPLIEADPGISKIRGSTFN